MPPAPSQSGVRFGAFEVDSAAGELRHKGVRIKLHEKPFQLLLALLEHPGELVTRKALQERLWPGDTFVEFENSLNNAIGRLREALGDTAATPRFIETIPRRGYRFIAEVSQAASTPPKAHFRRWLVAGGLALAFALVVLAVVTLIRLDRASAEPIKSLAVLPFRDLGTGAQDDYFASGMTDAVTTELATLGVSKVTSETSIQKFKNTTESVPEIARTLGVDAVVEGAVLHEGDRVRITVQLIRAETDKHVWAQSYEREMTNVLALQDEVALGVAQAINLKLSTGALAGLNQSKQVNPEAYKDYLKGQYYLTEVVEDPLAHAKDYFQQAIQLDPTYAPAYTGLAFCYDETQLLPTKQAMPEAKKYAEEALQLDPNLPDAHLTLAEIAGSDWNWPAADQEFEKAITLAPSLVIARVLYTSYLVFMGRDGEAMTQAQRAEDLDPLSTLAHNTAARARFGLGQYDQALEEGHRIIELDPNNPAGYHDLAVAYFQKGMYSEALHNTEKCIALTNRDPYFLAFAALIHGHLGQMKDAQDLLQEMQAVNRKHYVSPLLFATAYVGLQEPKQAIDALEEGYKIHDAYMTALYATPWFSPLRPDPRFQRLLREMNFPPNPAPPQ